MQPTAGSSPVNVGYFYGMLLVSMTAPLSFSYSFDFSESLEFNYDNFLSINFQPATNSINEGYLFLDIKDELISTYIVQRVVLCTLSGNANAYCLFQPKLDYSTVTPGQYFNKQQFVSHRIQVLGITSLQSSSTYTLKIHTNFLYKQTNT